MEFEAKAQLGSGQANSSDATSATFLLGGIIDEPLLLAECQILAKAPRYKL